MARLTIGRLAGKSGVGVETVRFYERSGLIARPPRPAGGFRVYELADVERIQFVRRAQQLGFSLGEIRELLALRAAPATDCRAVRAQAIAKRDEVERKIAELTRMRGALNELISTCPGSGALRSCTILEALRSPPKSAAPAGARRRRTKGYPVKTTILKIDGMHCEGCAQTLQFLLGREAGVHKITVSFADREARILHEPSVIEEDRLSRVIKTAGFQVAASG